MTTRTETATRILQYIGDDFVPPSSNAYIDDVDPATGHAYAQVPDGDANDVDRAVAAAKKAFPAWSATPAAERSRLLMAIADAMEQEIDALARIESIDSGKPIALARAMDIPRAIANFRFFATAILHTKSELHATDTEALNYTLRRPLGVVAGISPWNLPLYLLTWKIAPALAAGNTVVAKPSEITPMSAFELARIAKAVGLPAGVLNIIHGRGPQIGPSLTGHPDVKAISFTGGTATGTSIAAIAAPKLKKLSLELGGKNPNVVFADADLDDAVKTGLRAAFRNQGQICLCGSRILVEQSAYDEFVERFVAGAVTLRQGDPLDTATEQGAIVSKQHFDKIMSYLSLAKEEGGTILCGGGAAPKINERCKDGWFIQPTVIVDLPMSCRTNQEEIFGPVVTIAPFKDEDEAVQLANDTPYGLSATLWTQSLNRAHRVADRIDAGTVWVNCWMFRDLRVPFGGMKASGVGREGGDDALHFFTEPKNVCVKT
ncbi:MAG TPA: aldehyde dehydrogenase [Candidatus Polarisedimenticolaceae bacterium]|nr:aldehyde dehydrogenase [Candidatus Polarisedimenticolaceae bacterium]